MELTFIFYIFAAFILIPGTFFIMGTIFKKYMAGGIGAIGMLIIFIVFGIQTFSPDGSYKSKITTPTSWPPSINYCPDFLSLYPYPEVSGGYVCVDTVGVSNTFTKFIVTSTSKPNSTQIFDLLLNTTDYPNTTEGNSSRTSKLQTNCNTKGLTFEGIYDGANGSPNIAPRPS